MLTILLQPKSHKPLYQQIAHAITQEIACGHLQPKEKLPSRRALAAHLQVSIITVQTAYEQLVSEGYLFTKPRCGYFVDPDVHLFAHMPPKRAIPVSHEKTTSANWITFSTRGVDLEQFPFSTWAKLSRQVLSVQAQTLLQSLPSMGLYALRAAIADHLWAFRGIQTTPEQILVGAGTEVLLGILVQLLGASKRFAVEDPGYHKGKLTLRSSGASVIGIPMDAQGISMEALEKNGVSVALVTPSHQFPTGIIMPVRRRAALLEWATAQPGRYIIEDDFDSELRFQGKPLPAIFSMDTHGCVIYLNTFARTLAPSLRIGYAVLPVSLAKQYQTTLSFYSSTVPSFEQYTLVHFLKEGHLEHHLNRMKKVYRKRQRLLKSILCKHPLAPYIQMMGEEAGLHLLLAVHLDCTENELIQAAQAAHITISGISAYYDAYYNGQANTPNYIVLGYASLNTEQLTTGFQRLLDAWVYFLPHEVQRKISYENSN